MCVITVCKNRKLTEDELHKMWEGNPEGAGVAWVEGGKVHYKKGIMKLAELKAFYNSRSFSLPHIVHFRIASAGGVSPELTHPFTCSKDSALTLKHEGSEEALFHNGTYSKWGEILATTAIATGTKVVGPVSDSRLIAMLRFWVPEMLPQVAKESYGRIAIISPDGKVHTWGNFTEHDGIATSNDYWLAKPQVLTCSNSHIGGGEDGDDNPFSIDQSFFLSQEKADKKYRKQLRKAEKKGDKKKAAEILTEAEKDRILRIAPRYRSPWLHPGSPISYGTASNLEEYRQAAAKHQPKQSQLVRKARIVYGD